MFYSFHVETDTKTCFLKQNKEKNRKEKENRR